MGKWWSGLLLLTLGWVPPVWADTTPEQLKLWRQPALVALNSGYQGQWQWQQRTWDTVTQALGTGVFVHPNGYILTLATLVQATVQGEAYGQQLLLEDLARQRLELYNQIAPDQKIPITPATLREAVAYIRPEARLEQFRRLNEVFLSGGQLDQSYRFQLVTHDPQRNLALVSAQLTQTPTLVFGETQPPPVGTTVYALAQTPTQDRVTATLYTGTWNGQGMTFPSVQGLAGAIVLLANGEVLGLAAVQGNRVTLIPNATIRQFLQAAGVENQESPVNALWQEGLTHFWQAHYRRARPVLQQVIDRYPQHHEAQTLLVQATERIAQGQDRSPLGWWQKGLVVAGGAVVVLGIGAVGLAIWFSRRPRPVPPVQGIPAMSPPEMDQVKAPAEKLTLPPPTAPPEEAPPTQMLTPPPGEVPTRLVAPPPEPVTQVITPAPQVPVTEEYRPSRLECISGPLLGEEFTLVGTHYLGRDPQRCEIVIPDPQVSGQHACIEVTDTQVILRDCGSTNGTFINSVQYPRIKEVHLQDQDVIILGQKGTVKFRFHA